MSGGTGGPEHTATRSAVLAARGYPAEVVAGNGHRAAVVAGNGNGHQVDEVDELPAVEVEHEVAPDATPAPRCALPGCDEPLPSGRRKYHAPACAAEAERRRARRKTQREAKKRQAARRARPSSRSSAPATASPPAVDDRPRPGAVEVATQLLASGAVGEVELDVDGTLVVARAR